VVPPAAGDVVLVPFPFSDLSTTKVRPAVCLADAGRGDWVLCQVTTSPYGDPLAEPLAGSDFAIGGLPVASFARPSKLFTANASLLVGIVGRLNGPALQRLLDATIRVFRLGP
jgi:mRNA interferase MazF